ncbi:MAG: DUF1749 domain-containing protein [Clostridia bacterium]|nr:DUF1749 domain-containing protein [Clostridia bacterium]
MDTITGTTLYGCFYGETYRDVCVILTPGTCGNIFENKFLQVIGDKLEEQRISYICAHNSGSFHIIDLPHKINGTKRCGFSFELFEDWFDDIDAWINYAKSLGYKKIVLGGHSLGASKVINYLSNKNNSVVDNYILLSPVDLSMQSDKEKEQIPRLLIEAKKHIENNQPEKILSVMFDDYNVFCARSFIDFMNLPNHFPIYQKNGKCFDLKKINIKGLFVIGEKDWFANQDAKKHLLLINENTKNKNNKMEVINNTGHTYQEKEIELSNIIIDFIKNCNKKVRLMPK